MKSRILTSALALTLLASGAWVMSESGAEVPLLPASASAQDSAQTDLVQDAEVIPVEITEMVLGAEDAPVTVIEYASYTCPHCATFHEEQFAPLKAEYIDTGKVRFIYREVFFDRPSLWAAMLARCGGEMRYWGMQDFLFDSQRNWIGDGDLVGVSERLRKLGVAAGMDQEQIDACMSDAATAGALVEWSETNREADDINATPTLVINGETHSNRGYANLSQAIEAVLAAEE